MSDDMTAGPEMDARVATEVLGATYEPRFPGDVAGYYSLPPDGHYATRCISEELPGYSSSMDAAMDVVSHMQRQGWCWSFHDRGSLGWAVWAMHQEHAAVSNVLSSGVVNGHPSLAEAVCVAALKASAAVKKGVGDEDYQAREPTGAEADTL